MLMSNRLSIRFTENIDDAVIAHDIVRVNQPGGHNGKQTQIQTETRGPQKASRQKGCA